MDGTVIRFRERMACLADHSRFRIVITLAEGEQCVTAIARSIGLSQSCTTRHLQALQRRGLVQGRREGRQVVFRVCAGEPEVRLMVEAARAAVGEATSEAPAPLAARGAGTSSGAAARVHRGSRQPAPSRKRAGVTRRPATDSVPITRDQAPERDDDAADTGPFQRAISRSNDLEDFLL